MSTIPVRKRRPPGEAQTGGPQHPLPETGDAPAPHEIEYRHDAAHYISSMLTELRQIAGKAGFEKLVTALDAAYYEAYGALGAHPKTFSEPQEHNNGANEKTADAAEQRSR
jgi:hypothetical protein